MCEILAHSLVVEACRCAVAHKRNWHKLVEMFASSSQFQHFARSSFLRFGEAFASAIKFVPLFGWIAIPVQAVPISLVFCCGQLECSHSRCLFARSGCGVRHSAVAASLGCAKRKPKIDTDETGEWAKSKREREGERKRGNSEEIAYLFSKQMHNKCKCFGVDRMA